MPRIRYWSELFLLFIGHCKDLSVLHTSSNRNATSSCSQSMCISYFSSISCARHLNRRRKIKLWRETLSAYKMKSRRRQKRDERFRVTRTYVISSFMMENYLEDNKNELCLHNNKLISS